MSENLPMPRSSVVELVNAWLASSSEITQAFALIITAQQRLDNFFSGGCGTRDVRIVTALHQPHYDNPGETLEYLERNVWSAIIERSGLRQILPLAKIKELDEMLGRGRGSGTSWMHKDEAKLPPLTIENVMAMLQFNMENMDNHLNAKVREVYEMLRPRGRMATDYVTNQKSAEQGIGKRIVLSYACEQQYNGNGFRISYADHITNQLRALDQVFHLLDRKPWNAASGAGQIVDAVHGQTNRESNAWATDYFKGRCFINRNMHLEFKRPDLVAKFNLIAGGANLTDTKKHS